MTNMNYAESVDFVQNAALFGGEKHGLANITELLSRMDDPQNAFRIIHVAGTNGKGSICACLDSMLRETGKRVGLYTSPYLMNFTERIRIDGEEVSEEVFARWANRVRELSEDMVRDGFTHPTFFELVTAICFAVFREANVDIAVVEVGLGGRLDATNVVSPDVCVIANIGLDHVTVLGDTVEAIAREKAGIMKPGVPVVIYPQQFHEAYAQLLVSAREVGAPVFAVRDALIRVVSSGTDGTRYRMRYQETDFGELHVRLPGHVQVTNSATAVLAALVFAQTTEMPLKLSHIMAGLEKVTWAGRFEVLSEEPFLMMDGAHNPQGAEQVAAILREWFPNSGVTLLTGMLRTKDASRYAAILSPCAARVVVTTPDSYKALPAAELAGCYRDAGAEDVRVIEDPTTALKVVTAMGDPVVVSGSLYLVGALRKLYISENQ